MTEPNATRRSSISIGLLSGLLYLLPLAAFLYSGRSLFFTFWEFACYRYYGSLSLLNHDFSSVWLVQGFPMAILQTWFARYFSTKVQDLSSNLPAIQSMTTTNAAEKHARKFTIAGNY